MQKSRANISFVLYAGWFVRGLHICWDEEENDEREETECSMSVDMK